MAYSIDEKNQILNNIFQKVEGGLSVRKAIIEEGISSKTFYDWVDEDDDKVKRYMRAREDRADKIADEILEIADDSCNDNLETERGLIENKEWVNRSKLRVESRKWLLAKLNPTKYGDRVFSESKVTIEQPLFGD